MPPFNASLAHNCLSQPHVLFTHPVVLSSKQFPGLTLRCVLSSLTLGGMECAVAWEGITERAARYTVLGFSNLSSNLGSSSSNSLSSGLIGVDEELLFQSHGLLQLCPHVVLITTTPMTSPNLGNWGGCWWDHGLLLTDAESGPRHQLCVLGQVG